MTRPWCLRRRRRKRRSPRTSLSSLLSTCSTMGFGGVASGTQLTSGIAGGWPLPMGHRLAIRYGGLHGSSAVGHGDVATMVLLGWCLVRQWIHVPASTYCGGPSFSSSSKWWILLLFTETGTHSVNCASRRLPCHGAEDVSLGLVSRPRRFPSCSTLIRCSMSLLRSSSRFLRSRGRRSRSHSCSLNSPGQVVVRPLCATTDAYGCRSSSTVKDVPVIMRDSGSAPDSVHRGYGGHSSSQQRQVLDLTVAAMMGLFDAFCVIFRATPVIPELSASFSSFRVLTTVSARGLQRVCQLMTVVRWTYTHS